MEEDEKLFLQITNNTELNTNNFTVMNGTIIPQIQQRSSMHPYWYVSQTKINKKIIF